MSGKEVKAYEIKEALAEYHPKDFFITECKTDSTYFAGPQGLLIFDGLAITKSYRNPCVTGYEIKVSRSDFQRDNKYHLYLQYCNEFYFVVPTGMLKKDEIPDNMGLIYYNPETGKLLKKKRALYRQIEEPVGVYKYIIFSRMDQERIPFYESRAEYAKAYIEDKQEKREIGYVLGSKMAQDLEDAHNRLRRVAGSEEKLELAEKLVEVMDKNGIYCWKRSDYPEKLQKALQGKVLPGDFKRVKDNLEIALRIINQMSQTKEEEEK